MKRIATLLALTLSLLTPFGVRAQTITAAFSSFDATNIQAFKLNGNAVRNSSDVRLTAATNNQAGSAFWLYKVRLDASRSFSTHFSFSMTGGSGPISCNQTSGQRGADGLTFTIQNRSNLAGGAGAGIGYSGITDSMAIEFDSFRNDDLGDPDDTHIGLDTGGNITSIATGTPTNGTSNFVVDNGSVYYVWVDYDGSTDLLEVRINNSNSRPSTASLTNTIDLTSVLPSRDVYFGFTSGTGGCYANHNIHSFYFSNAFVSGGLDPIGHTYTAAPFRIKMTNLSDTSIGGGLRRLTLRLRTEDYSAAAVLNETLAVTTTNGTISNAAPSTGGTGEVDITVDYDPNSGDPVVEATGTGGAYARSGPPVVLYTSTTSIGNSTATLNGETTDFGGESTFTDRGVCVSKTTNPALSTTGSTCFSAGSSAALGSFTASGTGLDSGTLYYTRSYATSARGTGYSSQTTFTTTGPTPTPTSTPTHTPTITPTPTLTPTATPSFTPTATATAVPTETATNTPTPSPTSTPTVTPSSTATPAPTATATVAPTDLAGTILDPSGKPAVNVVVYLYRQNAAGERDEAGTLSAITDINGVYRFTGVPSGNYRVVPSREDLTFDPPLVFSSAGSTAPTVIAVPKSINDAGCTKRDAMTAIVESDASARAMLDFALTQSDKYLAVAERKLSRNDYRTFRKDLREGVLRAQQSFTRLLRRSEILPKIALTCAGAGTCKRVNYRNDVKRYRLFVNNLRRLTFFVVRKSREALDDYVRFPSDTLERSTVRLHSIATKRARQLPVQSYTCPER